LSEARQENLSLFSKLLAVLEVFHEEIQAYAIRLIQEQTQAQKNFLGLLIAIFVLVVIVCVQLIYVLKEVRTLGKPRGDTGQIGVLMGKLNGLELKIDAMEMTMRHQYRVEIGMPPTLGGSQPHGRVSLNPPQYTTPVEESRI
jgi:hypothetical protein